MPANESREARYDGASTGGEGRASIDQHPVRVVRGAGGERRRFGGATSWTLDVQQPGTANAVAVGKGKRYVTLPYQISCGSHKAVVKATGKARKVRSVVFRAVGKKVAAARHLRPGQTIKLKGIPKSATSIMPKGLLDKLTHEEILDLLADVIARGDAKHKLFEGGHEGHKH